ncbi:UNVERIFIED_CONTAM: hypothetical protein FKN15_034858 [Acipenser sinensis]
MDTRTFYGRKEHDRAVRVIPSDSELEESDNEDSELEDSQEDWIPESGECLSVDNETESEDEDVAEVDVPRLPQWRTPHNTYFNAYPEWQCLLSRSDDIMSPLQYFKQFFSEDILEVIVGYKLGEKQVLTVVFAMRSVLLWLLVYMLPDVMLAVAGMRDAVSECCTKKGLLENLFYSEPILSRSE